MADEQPKTGIEAQITQAKAEQLHLDKETVEQLDRQLNIGQKLVKLASEGKGLAEEKKNIQSDILGEERKLSAVIENLVKFGYANSAYEKEIFDLSQKITALKQEELGIVKQIQNQEKFDEALSKLKLKGLYDAAKQLKDTFAAHPGLAFISVLTNAFISFVKIFRHLDEAAANFRISMGLLRPTTVELEKNIRGVYFTMIQTGVEAKDLYEALQAGAATMGTMQSTTVAMAGDMALLKVQLGVAQTTSAAFAMSMGMAAKDTMDSQKNVALFTAALSEAAGTNLNEVMQDVANATKSSYQFMIKEPATLAKAAIEARRMGTSLQDTAKSAASLINFTESVNAEMQASVLLGESINLQRLRELSYRKQLGAVNKEILEIAKKTHFDDLDPFQQDAVAKALGKSAEEVGKMLQADREMKRIRGDGSLTKQLQMYDKLKDSSKELVRITGEENRVSLMNMSNQESIKAISLALKSIYQSMFQPLVELAAVVLPAIAKGLNYIREQSNAWVSLLAAGLLFIGGPMVIGRLLTLAKAGIFKLLGKDVADGAAAAGAGVKEGFIDKVAKGVGGLEKIATSFGRIIVKLGAAVGRGIGSVLQFTLRGLAAGLKALGTPQVLLGAIVLGIVGLAFMAFGKAAEFVARALKSLEGVNLVKMAGGLALIGLAMLPLALITPIMLPLSLGLFAFGAALRWVAGPAERMGDASVKLGEGLTKAAEGLAAIKGLSIMGVIKQFKDLANIVADLSKEFESIPEIKIEKIQDIIVKSAQVAGQAVDKTSEQMLSALMDIKNSVDALRNSLEKGGISANVQIDSQKLESATARTLAFKGTKSPQPSFI